MIKRVSLIFLLYLGLAVILTWPLARLARDHVINAGDPLFYAWNFMHNTRALTHGFTGLLDTNIYYPTTNTLAFSDTLAAQTLFAAPIIWLTHNPILAENLYVLLTFPVAGIGMYLLVKSLTKYELAAVFSGAMYAFSYIRFGQVSHVPAVSSQWFPYYFYGLYWFLTEGKFRHLAVALISFLLLLGSTVYFGVFAIIVSLVMTSAFLISWMNSHTLATSRVRLKVAFLPLVFTGAISLILMYPYIRLKAEHPEITRSLAESSARAAYQEDYTSVTNVSLLAPLLKTNEGERTLYPTVALLLLVVLGLGQWKKKRHRFPILVFVAVALTGLILSFGPERPFSIGQLSTGYITLPYKYLYTLFPLLQILRVPARFSIIFLLGVCVIAGYGIVALVNSKTKLRRILIPALISILFLMEIWQKPLSLVAIPTYNHAPLVYMWLRSRPDVRAIVELPIGNIEEGTMPIQEQVMLPYENITEATPLAAETYRVYFAGLHEKKTMNGYSGYVARSFHDAVNDLSSFPNDSSIRFLQSQGVSHIIVHVWQMDKEERKQYAPDSDLPELTRQLTTPDGDIVYAINPR